MISFITRPSITRRIFIALVFASMTTWVVMYSETMIEASTPESGSYDQLLSSYANVIDKIYETYPEKKDLHIALTGLDTMIEVLIAKHNLDPHFLNFSVWSKDGVLQAKSRSSSDVRMGGNQQVGFYIVQNNAVIPYKYNTPLLHQLTLKKNIPSYRVYVKPIQGGKFYIQMTQSMNSRYDAMNASALNYEGTIKPILISFPLILILLLIAVYTGLKPLRLFSQELAQRKPGNLQTLHQPYVYSELAPLINEFNATLIKLQDLLQREREFLTDAAHELRTPLALITVQSDVLIHAENSRLREEASHRLTQGIARANRLVNQLLALARMESDDIPMMRELDIADLVRECLTTYANEAKRLNIELSYDGPDSYICNTPNDALYSMISNLVNNAISYGHPAGHVIVKLITHTDTSLQLQILDDGPGIDPQQQEKMFLRFHRGTNTRSCGSGLGLAIVTSAVQLLKAQLQIHAGIDGKGIGFTIIWNKNQE